MGLGGGLFDWFYTNVSLFYLLLFLFKIPTFLDLSTNPFLILDQVNLLLRELQ